MADKPRLKDSDEILNALRGGKPKAPPPPTISGRDIPDPPPDMPNEPDTPEPAPAEPPAPPAEEAPQKVKKTVKRRLGKKTAQPAAAQEPPPIAEPELPPEPPSEEEPEDKSPLDFGRYQLPDAPTEQSLGKRAADPRPAQEVRTAAEPPPPAAAPDEPEPVLTDQGPKIIQPYQFESLDEPQTAPPPPEPAPEPKPKPARRARRPKPEPEPEPAPSPAPEPEPVGARESEPAADPKQDAADPREQFIRELSNRFDEEFNQRFEGRAEEEALDSGPAADVFRAREPRPSGGSRRRRPELTFTPKAPKRRAAPVPEPEEEEEPFPQPAEPRFDAREEPLSEDAEADSFLAQFARQVREEEQQRSEDFKDTLAQKFERERARYLRELGIEAEAEEMEEEPEEPAPPRRKLDLRIQPEMHGAAPVTYSRTGAVRSLDEDLEDEDDEAFLTALEAEATGVSPAPPKSPSPKEAPDGPKTPEELLLELGAQNSMRRVSRQRALHLQQQRALQKQFQFVPQTDQDNVEPAEKGGFFRRYRVVLLSAAIALVVLVGLSVTIAMLMGSNKVVDGTEGWTGISEDAEGTLVVYENRNPEVRGEYDDVLIRRPNVSVSNMSVANYLVIEEVPGSGFVHLENVTVGGAIYLNNCPIDSLRLRNVSATRVVITNAGTEVSVDISGAGLIQTLEVRSPVRVTQTPMQGSETMGVRDILLRRGESGETLSAALDGVDLVSLSSYGSSVLSLSADSFVEEMTVEGSLSLSGSGRVHNLTAGPDDEGRMSLDLQEGTVTRLSLRGVASLSLGGRVDSLIAMDDLTVSGSGSITTLTVNARSEGGRIRTELSGVDVQTLISNAETRVNAAGSAKVYELTANSSVYALGNKVNHLIVNADGVIYQNEPDRLTVAPGIQPPGSVADNPNINFDLSSEDNDTPLEAADDGIATICGHSREVGGFTAGNGSASNPYEVSNAAQLAHISLHLDSHFVQVMDIDVADDTRFITGFDMIGGSVAFTGSYDGNGCEIRNLRISSAAENVGLFAENNGAIRNVRIVSGEIRSTSEGRAYVGSVVGVNAQNGLVEACSNEARVIGNNESSFVGGIAGYNLGGRVRNCYNAARISNAASVGGVVGVNRSDALVSSSYNVGIIEGTVDAGSVVGNNSGGIVTNCYYLVETAQEGIGSGSGTATAKTSLEFESSQMVADLSAGSDDTPWIAGTGSYVYPTLRKPDEDSRTAAPVTVSDPEPASDDVEVLEE